MLTSTDAVAAKLLPALRLYYFRRRLNHRGCDWVGADLTDHELSQVGPTMPPKAQSDRRDQRSERHVKCDRDAIICAQCKTDGIACVRSRPKPKFRVGSSAKYDAEFPKDQIWLSTKRQRGRVRYVDETENLKIYYANDGQEPPNGNDADLNAVAEAAEELGQFTSLVVEKAAAPVHAAVFVKPPEPAPQPVADIHIDHVYDFELPPAKRPRPDSFVATSSTYEVESRDDEHQAIIRTTSFATSDGRPSPLSPLAAVIRPAEPHDQSVSNITEAMLLRYFIEDLSRWFDLNDPTKYFRITVPQRARTCQPLMNAILTASARHLTRIKRYQDYDGVIRYENRALPELKTETALHYHNECIKDLIHTSSGINVMGTEDFLSAAIILRFYEEVDAPLRDEERDSELFRQMAMTFFKTRPDVSSPDYISTTSPALGGSLDRAPDFERSPAGGSQGTTTQTPRSWTSEQPAGSDRPHHAPYWVALRQEIHNSFVHQRAFLIPLPKASIFRTFEPTTDEIWGKRLVVFCADTIDFCYGTTNTHDPRWHELKQSEEKFIATLPPSFAPIYYCEPIRTRSEVFPEIWYLDDWHATGAQHMELARILLAVHDPTRPKIGRGHVAGMKAMNEELKVIVLRICGMALGRPRMPPGLNTAMLGITTCGELFEDPLEQRALMSILDELEEVHAWPCTDTRKALEDAWGWQEET